MASLVDILPYYSDRLILQYRDKPRARAMVALAIKQMIADAILLDIQNAFDLDTAYGEQLTILGKYIGVPRYYQTALSPDYYGFKDYDTGEPQNNNGMRDYDGGFNESVLWLSYETGNTQTAYIPDTIYRTLLKLQVDLNKNDSTIQNIQKYLLKFFGESVYLVDNHDMTMTYIYNPSSIPIAVELLPTFLPHPMGVLIDLVDINTLTSAFSLGFTDGFE